MKIRDAQAADMPRVAEIYNYYIINSVVTFAEQEVSASDMLEKFSGIVKKYPFLVAENEAGRIIGYAYCIPFRTASAYRNAESTIYLDSEEAGKGYGSKLYSELMKRMKQLGFRTVIGVITMDNAASIAMHERMGFIRAGLLTNAGFKLGRWLNVGLWELNLEKYPDIIDFSGN